MGYVLPLVATLNWFVYREEREERLRKAKLMTADKQ
jgi:hypothetical protein